MADSRPIGPEILENLRYDPTVKSGLVWATSRKGARSGDVAGHLNPSSGYWHLKTLGHSYTCQRLVWALFNGDPGDSTIDHINCVRDDNRIENLRLATRSQQQYNRAASGQFDKGVTLSSSGWWRGRVYAEDTKLECQSRDKEVVVRWLERTRAELHKEYANHG